MPRTPAMTTGMMERITISGRITPMEEMPTPDLAVPYAAPRFANTIADVTPMKPKNDDEGSHGAIGRVGVADQDGSGGEGSGVP